jgi:hypothetical protein
MSYRPFRKEGLTPQVERQADMIRFLKVQYFSKRIEDIYIIKREIEWIGIPRWIINIFVPNWERQRDGRMREIAHPPTEATRGGE